MLKLLGYPDSNQERQDQNLQCYHYTIPQTDESGHPPEMRVQMNSLSILAFVSPLREVQRWLVCY